MNRTIVLSASTRKELERKLDDFLAEGKPFKSVPLILPADGRASRTTYKDFSVRTWYRSNFALMCKDEVHDAAIELIGEAAK